MSLLDRAVDTVESWGDDRKDDRAAFLKLLEQAADQMQRAIAVWSAMLEKAPESSDRFTAVLWMGAEPAKQLQAIHFEIKDTAAALTELTGVQFKDSLNLADVLDIVQPYDQMGPGESVSDRAASAIRVMTARKQRIEGAVEILHG